VMERFKPKYKDVYYYVTGFGTVDYRLWEGDNHFDQGCYNFGNCFNTEQEAETHAQQLRDIANGCAFVVDLPKYMLNMYHDISKTLERYAIIVEEITKRLDTTVKEGLTNASLSRRTVEQLVGAIRAAYEVHRGLHFIAKHLVGQDVEDIRLENRAEK